VKTFLLFAALSLGAFSTLLVLGFFRMEGAAVEESLDRILN
jgi:hypothetical protein